MMSLVAQTAFDISEMGFMGVGCQTPGQFGHLRIIFMTGEALGGGQRLV